MSYIVGLELPPVIYDQLGAYLEILLRWNAKTNLSAIRDPGQIVTRHFGESLFAAGVLFGGSAPLIPLAGATEKPGVPLMPMVGATETPDAQSPPGAPLIPAVGMSGIQPGVTTLADLGSGAGFPGIPIKLAFPQLQVTLIESQNKKATFLKEVIRALRLDGVEVYNGRAEQWGNRVDVVTLRAVERFESALTAAAQLQKSGGRICLLIGASQRASLSAVPDIKVQVEQTLPDRRDSMVVVGNFG